MRKTKKVTIYRRKKVSLPNKRRVIDMNKIDNLYICTDETLWDEDINSGNSIWDYDKY